MPTPSVFLPYQQRWIADQAAVAVWEKSRRIGASWCDAADSVLMAAKSNGADALYISYNEEFTREYIDVCKDWARNFQIAASEVQEIVIRGEEDLKAFRIDFPSGNKVLGMSSKPRNLRGKQGKVVIDEAAFHDDLKGLMKAAMSMLIWGGRVRVISTHNGRHNPFNTLVKSIRAGETPYSLHRTTFSEALDDGLYERICFIKKQTPSTEGRIAWESAIRKNHGRDAAEELDVKASAGGNGLIKNDWLNRYSEPPAKFKRRVMSLDTANKPKRTSDRSACTCWLETESAFYLVKAWAERYAYPDLKRNVISTAEAFNPDVLLIEDAASGQALIQELRQDTRLPVVSVTPIKDKITRMEAESHQFESGRVLLPDHAAWLPEYETEILEFPSDNASAHDDYVDSTSQALSYMRGASDRFEALTGSAMDAATDSDYGISAAGWGSVTVDRPF